MKNARALLMALDPVKESRSDDEGESPEAVAKDAARSLLDSIRSDDADGVVESFQLLSRACSMMDEPDEDEIASED